MAVVALNWELGADWGHIARFLPIALGLRERGHEPVLLLRDLSRAHALFATHGIECLQAPLWLRQVTGLPAEINLTETLFRFGFLEPEGLMSNIAGWRALWKRIGAQLLVCDHAPTALLAARGLGQPTVVIGNSFAVPPLAAPLPPYRWWMAHGSQHGRLAETDRRLVYAANRALAAFGAPPLHSACDLWRVPQRYICGVPALDVYGERAGATYIGAINQPDAGEPPRWPEGEGPKLFAYLKPSYRHFDAALDALAAAPARVLAYAPGVPAATEHRHRGRVVFSPRPLRMAEVCAQADLGLCHAGGTTELLLHAGKPVLLLPMQMEQTMTARRAEATGACLHQPMNGDADALRERVNRLVTDPALARAARCTADEQPPRKSGLDMLLQGCCEALGPG